VLVVTTAVGVYVATSATVKKRARWIRGQMKNLGSGYLRGIGQMASGR